MKKTLFLTLALTLALMLAIGAAGCAKKDDVTARVSALNGPTGMGIAYLNSLADAGETDYACEVSYAGAPDDITGGLIAGDIDIAAVPVNLAAVLYNKTQGGVMTAAVNTLGVLYLVETGDSIHSLEDLEGKRVVAAGQGSTPEYALNYILENKGLSGKVEAEYLSEHAEALTQLASGNADIILVPEPFVTTALSKVEGARIAIDVTEEWAKAAGTDMVMGCLVVRKEFAEQHKGVLDAFLKDYAASAAYANENPSETAALIENYGIMASAAVAEKAIPNCNIVCYTGADMKSAMNGMLGVLFAANPKSVGGSLPKEDMYYMG